MIKFLYILFKFLASIYFAISLLTIAIIAVIAGTWIESVTGSHLYAAQWTYQHPLFSLLLLLFFVNILFSTLRRWPFKLNHIPFLITHLGLLMIILGTMIKQKQGLQGNLLLTEGSGNERVMLPQTYALSIQKRSDATMAAETDLLPLKLAGTARLQSNSFPSLHLKINGVIPHVTEKWETWFKGDYAYVLGLPPLRIIESDFTQGQLNEEKQNNALHGWHLLPIRTSSIDKTIHQAYLEGVDVKISSIKHPDHQITVSLSSLLSQPLEWLGDDYTAQLHLPFSEETGLAQPLINLSRISDDKTEQQLIPLSGPYALTSQMSVFSDTQHRSFEAELHRDRPKILLAQKKGDDSTYLFAYDRYGRVHHQTFTTNKTSSITSYDQGFGGYTHETRIPFPNIPCSRLDKERAEQARLADQIQLALDKDPRLAPPLILLKKAADLEEVNFTDVLLSFLKEWDRSNELLFPENTPLKEPLNKVIEKMNLEDLPHSEMQAMLWIEKIMGQMEIQRESKQDLFLYLKKQNWPLIDELKEMQMKHPNEDIYFLIIQQLISMLSFLPSIELPSTLSSVEKAHYLSAYFLEYGITYKSLIGHNNSSQESFEELKRYWEKYRDPKSSGPRCALDFTLETPLTLSFTKTALNSQLESQRPCLQIEVEEDGCKEILYVSYDPTSKALKWPILKGKYLIGFQPYSQPLPYRMRLRQARQLYHPESQQPYSYEADVLVTDKSGMSIEKTLSMNDVYETWEGYRFYLAGMGRQSEQSSHHAQIVVNYDPVKYYLTYPGGFLLGLGILLLFWLWPYKSKSKT